MFKVYATTMGRKKFPWQYIVVHEVGEQRTEIVHTPGQSPKDKENAELVAAALNAYRGQP